MASSSLSAAVSQAIVFLTKPLVASYSPSTLARLQAELDVNLAAHYAPSWNVLEPVKGSGRRTMTLSPSCLPPKPVWDACTAAKVQWFDWIRALGNTEFELFVDPGCVAVRVDGQIITVWQDAKLPAIVEPSHRPSKTLAQQIVESDYASEEEIFSLLNGQVAAPAWMPPMLTPFPVQPRSASPLSSGSGHSRCSSRSSNSSSSGFSLASGDTSRTSVSTSSSKSQSENKQSRRERARCARVFIDTSKTDVTPYDGGKTTVLTGGVMLGGLSKPGKTSKAATPAASTSNSWRSVRA